MTSHLRNSISRQFICDVTCAMERIAPLKLADSSWDNVGLLAESPLPLNERLILVTNDLSTQVVAEAVSKRASMIIAYHPPWFKAAKNMKLDGPLANINYCISNGISIFSPHTALDSISGGSNYFKYIAKKSLFFYIVNDWICKAFQSHKITNPTPIVQSNIVGFENCGFGRIIELENPISLYQAAELLKKYLKLKNCKPKLIFCKKLFTDLNSAFRKSP